MEPQRLVCERCDNLTLCFQYGGEWVCGDCETLEDELQYIIENKVFSKLPPIDLDSAIEYEEEEEE